MKDLLGKYLKSKANSYSAISGTDQDDVLSGSGVFEGGRGNDTIYAREPESKDTLRFNLGDGQDTIFSDDWSWDPEQDTVQFGRGITQEMIGFARDGNDLIVKVGDKGDQMTFSGFFASTTYQTFTRFEFADDTVWHNIRQTAQWQSTDFTTVIRGTDGNDVLRGGDTFGGAIFEGHRGNDIIYAREEGSKDTLRFNLGDGQDTIFSDDWRGVQDTVQFGKGITQEMIGFVRRENDLIVTAGNKGDQITFSGFFASTNYQTFTRFEFADGTVWHNIKETEKWQHTDFTTVICGTDSDDVLHGSGIFEGGKGNDTIYAQQLNSKDTLRFNLGDGQDTIYSSDLAGSYLKDTVQFGKGITQEMIDFSRDGAHLVVKVGQQGDQMTFGYFFKDKGSQTFTRFEFADGSVWDNIKESKVWKESIDNPAYRVMASHARSLSLESSVTNQANSLLTAMATFSPQEGIGYQPENNAQSAAILFASSAS